MLNLSDPAVQFLFFAYITFWADLIFAKWIKFRFHLAMNSKKKDGRFRFIFNSLRNKKWKRRIKRIKGLHIHHFNFGLAMLPLILLGLYYDQMWAPGLAGISTSLIGTEGYELVTMRWGQ